MDARTMTFDAIGETKPASIADVFDLAFPSSEHLPRYFEVAFVQSHDELGQHATTLVWQGRAVGDVLTDNASTDDGYRFHDAFHLAYAACLGWSPVTRKLFGCKRKSAMALHQVEDSGRATVTEEGVCALVHAYAVDHDFFQGTAVPSELWLAVARCVSRLEVRCRRRTDWEHGISQGYEVWLTLRKHGGGIVRGNLVTQRLEWCGRL